jgi:outer membrane protein OmpA-like peptidoglycan-associated protein
MNKMKNILNLICMLALLLPALCIGAVNLKKADKLYDNLLYEDAIVEYKKAIKEDEDNPKAIVRLAHCYRMLKNSMEAERWYAAAVQLREPQPTNYLYYSECLIISGKYPEATKWIKKYVEVQGSDSHASRIIQRLNNINTLMEDSLNFTVKKISVNSNQSDFGPVVFNNGLVFASAREKIESPDKKHVKSDEPFYYLYFARGTNENFKKPEVFAPTVFTKFNNGPICFNKAGTELYVTRNNVEDNKVKEGEGGVVNLKIYKFKKSKVDWTGETPFPYNSDTYSCAHAFLSADGNKLYFSSDMPGGYGKSDIWVCQKKGNKWNKPENLGPDVNTAESEGYPFEDDKNGMFFSSNGRGGLGGFDIFYTKKIKDGYDTPMNLGYPINSSSDDFGWVQNETGTTGYFTSNRGDRDNNDDIFCFTRMKALLNVLVYDSESNAPLAQSTVRVIESGKQSKVVHTSKNGYVNVFMEPGKTYRLLVENEGFASDSIKLNNEGATTASAAEIPVSLTHKVRNTDNYAENKEYPYRNSGGPTGVQLASVDNKIPVTIKKNNTGTAANKSTINQNSNPEDNHAEEGYIEEENQSNHSVAKKIYTNPNTESENESNDATASAEARNSNLNNSSVNGNTKKENYKSNSSRIVGSENPDDNNNGNTSNYNEKSENHSNNETYAMKEKNSKTMDASLYKNAVTVKLKNIYYDLNKHNIHPEGQKELDIAADILVANPEMKIEFSAHTDCRETETYNMTLSIKRAKEAAAYLIKNGIQANRIITHGYGETRLANHCECEGKNVTPCTEKQHQANRRTEINLLSFKYN